MKSKISAKSIAVVGMLCAISFVAVLLGKVIPNVAGFLSYDPKDAVVAIAGFMFGPLYTVAISVVVALVEMVSISGTGPVGCLMNILSTVSFAFPAALVYRKMKTNSYKKLTTKECAWCDYYSVYVDEIVNF